MNEAEMPTLGSKSRKSKHGNGSLGWFMEINPQTGLTETASRVERSPSQTVATF
jgi:hypothetical protein